MSPDSKAANESPKTYKLMAITKDANGKEFHHHTRLDPALPLERLKLHVRSEWNYIADSDGKVVYDFEAYKNDPFSDYHMTPEKLAEIEAKRKKSEEQLKPRKSLDEIIAEASERVDEKDEPEIEIRGWPEPPVEEAFSGLVGEFTRLWEPHTEASNVALAAQFLTFFGHGVGRNPYFVVGGDDHHTNLELALVGPTSLARKGQSYGCVRHQFSKVALDLNVPFIEARGLSSGEGLISAVRDSRSETDPKTGRPKVVDEGVIDKRLLVFESEFASVLRRMVRDGNTLSEVIRQAWDSGDLGTMTRNAPLRATNAHISLITHVTPADLQLYLNDVNTVNGFANRFIFLATRRARTLADPGRPDEGEVKALAVKIAKAIEFGTSIGEMKRSPEATQEWETLYARLSAPRVGRNHNALVARSTPHVLRLSMIYALLDHSTTIEVKHLLSASSLWDYAERTSRFVFGTAIGDKTAEQILAVLKVDKTKGFTTRELRSKVTDKKQVRFALELLLENGLVRFEETQRETPGRTGQRWFAL